MQTYVHAHALPLFVEVRLEAGRTSWVRHEMQLSFHTHYLFSHRDIGLVPSSLHTIHE